MAVQSSLPINISNSCCTPSRPSETAAPALAAPAPHCETAPDWRGMISIAGGAFLMGSDGPEAWRADGEGPVRRVEIAPFWMDECAVTVVQFARFVEATGYQTEAERFGWSFVFHKHVSAAGKARARGVSGEANWWLGVEGASWHRPEGRGSGVQKRGNHPVVHVSHADALAFCDWAGKTLPTEAQWEFAARGGLEGCLYPWGNELMPKGKKGAPEHRCNIWQGKFPLLDTGADGFQNTAPAKTFAPNALGLYQMSGNVWEWCADWFSPHHDPGATQNPSGPTSGTQRVIKGGSFLCHLSYCNRYRVAARTGNTPDSTTSHTGFRCVRNN